MQDSCKKKQINLKGEKRELLSIFFRRAFAIFRVSLSTIFSGTGYQKKVIFWSWLSKHVKREILSDWIISSSTFVFWSTIFANFPTVGYHKEKF